MQSNPFQIYFSLEKSRLHVFLQLIQKKLLRSYEYLHFDDYLKKNTRIFSLNLYFLKISC